MIDDQVEGLLSAHGSRLLGSLMEKQLTTPDYYPLTLKALMAACNQKSSRVPVMNLTLSEVGGVVNELRAEGLITARMDGRTDRYEQHLSRKLSLSIKERAVLCVLMLRGALTLNEIRINTARMVEFSDADELQALLDKMMDRDEPLLLRIPKAAGQREDRFAQLLCGKPDIELAATAGANLVKSDRITQLETDVADLQAEMKELRLLIELSNNSPD
ncbi:MAG: YceH family protein [Mariprofundus sp.]|nr:YceH family protein [Mariprofundus sp.]